MKFDITDKERLILANQYEILSKLDKNEGDYYARLAGNLRQGHAWLYNQAFDHLAPVLADEQASLVTTILGIYADMKNSYRDIKEETEGIDESRLEFPGFDGNNESELLGFTGALLEDGRYVHLLGKTALNSHCAMEDTYSRMIGRWHELGEPRYPLSKEHIQSLLSANRYIEAA